MAAIGEIIDGKYEILTKIGEGGMSVVYLAMDKRLNKQWAIKQIKQQSDPKANEVLKKSFMDEANLMKRLDHPSLPRIVDIIDNNQTIYVIMDYIEGESLNKILDKQGAQPQDKVIEWSKQLCDALSYLHNQNPPIVYRDMKPANIMLKPEGNLKLIDFGIARQYKETNIEDTVNLGTRGYAAPEQFGGQGQTDGRTDIYCLGVTIYHLVTGLNPSEPPYELYPIREVNPNLSGGLEKIIARCTRANPEERYQNCDELMYALEHYEEVDGAYRRVLKKRLRAFAVCCFICVLMLAVGLLSAFAYNSKNLDNYESLISISTATDYDEKTASYIEAINLIPGDTRAYIKLLEAYQDNGLYGDDEHKEFTALFNKYKNEFDATSNEYLELNYEIGVIYFYLYSGSDNSFRSRVLRADPFFTTVYESRNKDFGKWSIAQSYYIICDFYENYIVNATGVKEPTKESYDSLVASLNVCINNMQDYNSDDSAYIKLTMYQEIENLLSDHRKGFAYVGVDEEAVLSLFDSACDKAENLFVTRQISLDIQASVAENRAPFREAIERTYDNTGERSS